MTPETSSLIPDQPTQRPRLIKRVAETIAVALPILFIVAGMVLLPGSIHFESGTWVFIVAVALLAATIFTQYWIAYALLLAASIFFFLASGLLSIVVWGFGAIYLVIALANLIPLARRRLSRGKPPAA